MRCQSCKTLVYSMREIYCMNCDKPCICGCGLLIGTVKEWSEAIQNDPKQCIALMKVSALHPNKNLIKTHTKFIISHFPQYKDIAEKYLILM
jgi:hypothetical protein